jgi:hypothetical protein
MVEELRGYPEAAAETTYAPPASFLPGAASIDPMEAL